MTQPLVRFHVPELPNQNEFVSSLSEWLSTALPSYLPSKRWYGDKSKSIVSIEIDQIIPVATIGRPAALAIALVHFPMRESTSYLLPLMLVSAAPTDGSAVAELDSNSGSAFIVDGSTDTQFRSWFASAIAGEVTDPSLVADRLGAFIADFDRAREEPNRVLGVDQSNTSFAFGFDMLLKVIRRLQPGIHPDAELTRFLTSRTDFANVPHYFGSLGVKRHDGETSVIAVAQRFVESSGDGWTYLLQMLRRHISEGSAVSLIAESERIARRLGEVTAGMHLALASDPWTNDVAPEPIKRGDAERWSAEYIALIDRVAADLSDHQHRFDSATRDLVQTFLQLAPGLRKRDEGFYRLIGHSKTRVHGDYHLGQTLCTRSEDFVIIDFEGEPLRTIEERRHKTSPLKDVAGLLRSFSYARGTATAWLSEGSGLLASDLVNWERNVRSTFLTAYVDTVRDAGGSFLPKAASDVQAAIASWELDKAAYEVIYELNNRPDWLWIPLSSMLKQGEPEPIPV